MSIFKENNSAERSSETFAASRKIYTLDHLPRMQGLLSAVRTDTVGGEPFRASLKNIGSILAGEYKRLFQTPAQETGHRQSKSLPTTVFPAPLIIGIPRGGTPLAEGVLSALPNASYFLTNAGDERDSNQPLFPKTFTTDSTSQDILIVDTVVGSGGTVLRHLEALKEMNIDTSARIFLLSTIALSDYQGYGLRGLFSYYPDLTVITGCLEKKAEWKDRHNGEEEHLYVHGIGSVGDLVSVE
jgi:uracil phosphoribosyltransferase